MRAFWWVAVVGVPLMSAAAPAPSQKTVLSRAGAFVERYTRELPRLVATETLVQQQVPQPHDVTGPSATRRSQAEFAWVWLDREVDPIGFRDVIEVDGQPVGPDRRRLVELLHGPREASWAQARAILEEGARYNLSPGSRNFNLPTVVMFFLLPERLDRFSWKRRSDAHAPVWELTFREKRRPTLIRQRNGQPVFSRGTVWVETATGAIQRTELAIEIDRVRYALTTRFERIDALDLVLPVRLDERYATPEQVVTGSATYSNYRRFQTGARLIR